MPYVSFPKTDPDPATQIPVNDKRVRANTTPHLPVQRANDSSSESGSTEIRVLKRTLPSVKDRQTDRQKGTGIYRTDYIFNLYGDATLYRSKTTKLILLDSLLQEVEATLPHLVLQKDIK